MVEVSVILDFEEHVTGCPGANKGAVVAECQIEEGRRETLSIERSGYSLLPMGESGSITTPF
jgi:hypothetical protein